MWLPYNNSKNQIKVTREPHMKHNVTQLEGKHEPVNFLSSVLGNHFLELELRNYQAKSVSHESDTQSDLLQFSWDEDIDCNIVDLVTKVGDVANQVDLDDMFWILFFDVKCMNNTAECEAPSLKKVVELNRKDLNFFGNLGENHFQQQLRETHPKLEPLIQKEMKKLDYVHK